MSQLDFGLGFFPAKGTIGGGRGAKVEEREGSARIGKNRERSGKVGKKPGDSRLLDDEEGAEVQNLRVRYFKYKNARPRIGQSLIFTHDRR